MFEQLLTTQKRKFIMISYIFKKRSYFYLPPSRSTCFIPCGALCAMSASHNLLRSAFNLLPTGVSLRDLGGSFLVDIHSSDLKIVPRTLTGHDILPICTKLQNN